MEAESERPCSSSSLTSNSNNNEDEESSWDGHTFFDFEGEDSVPNLTVKTFLRDCFQHPKILFHKDFEFFRTYLRKLGHYLELPSNAPFTENHEDISFCVDKGDKWLVELKKRAKSTSNEEFYWAAIIPVQRKWTIGMIILKWEPQPMSLDFLRAYIRFCQSKSEIIYDNEVVGQDLENVDAYIKDFLSVFECDRNIDVEECFNDAKIAANYRRQNNLTEPSRTDLSYLFRRHSPRQLQKGSATTASKSSPGSITKQRSVRLSGSSSNNSSTLGNNNNNNDDNSDSESSSGDSISSGSSWGSQYKLKNRAKNHTKQLKSKPAKVTVQEHLKKRSRPNGLETLPTSLSSQAPSARKRGIIRSRFNDYSSCIQVKVVLERLPESMLINAAIKSSSSLTQNQSTVNVPNSTVTKAAGESSRTHLALTNSGVIENGMPNSKNKNGFHGNNQLIPQAKKSQEKGLRYLCEICWFGTSFPTQKLLETHMDVAHSSRKRNLITCKCGVKMQKQSLEIHARHCKIP